MLNNYLSQRINVWIAILLTSWLITLITTMAWVVNGNSRAGLVGVVALAMTGFIASVRPK
jgi:hypothetical protein